MEQLTGRVWYLPHETAADRPVLGYVRGERRTLMLDAGNSPRHAALFLRDLRRGGLPAPDLVALTHRHWDHTFGLCALPIPAVACLTTQRYLEAFSAIRWDEAAALDFLDGEGIREFSEGHLRLEYPDLSRICVRPADLVFRRELEIDLGGCRCVLRTLTSSHSDDSVLILVPEEGVLFLGDAGCEACVRGAWIDDPVLLRREIAELEALDFSVCLNGHTAPMTRAELFDWLSGRLAAL